MIRGTTSGQAFDRPLLNAVQNAVSISVLAAPATGVSVTVDDYLEGKIRFLMNVTSRHVYNLVCFSLFRMINIVFERTRITSVVVAPGDVTLTEVKESLRSAGVKVR